MKQKLIPKPNGNEAQILTISISQGAARPQLGADQRLPLVGIAIATGAPTAFTPQRPPRRTHLSLRSGRQMVFLLLLRVVLQPQWGVLGARQRPGGREKRLDGPDVAAGEGGEDSGQTFKLPSAQHLAP